MKRVIHEAARRELPEAITYYREISPSLGLKFQVEMERLIETACAHPLAFHPFDPPARRHFSEHFPYGIISLVETDHIWIVAVMHLHRAPKYGGQRLG